MTSESAHTARRQAARYRWRQTVATLITWWDRRRHCSMTPPSTSVGELESRRRCRSAAAAVTVIHPETGWVKVRRCLPVGRKTMALWLDCDIRPSDGIVRLLLLAKTGNTQWIANVILYNLHRGLDTFTRQSWWRGLCWYCWSEHLMYVHAGLYS